MSDQLDYRSLPIVAEEGFPQSFRLSIEQRIYRFTLYVNISEALLETTPRDAVLELPQADAYMVARVARESSVVTPETIFLRKVVPHIDYEAAELALRFSALRVARLNLNGVGAHGSSVKGGVAVRWASYSGTG